MYRLKSRVTGTYLVIRYGGNCYEKEVWEEYLQISWEELTDKYVAEEVTKKLTHPKHYTH